jgi:sterol desaturase/sphingolipid hydroxylase (fatty acid hydroxylase superfamily)
LTTVISKSLTGLPLPGFPQGVDLGVEARKSRRRLYPVTILYSLGALSTVTVALSMGRNPFKIGTFFVAGVAAWTYVEYLAHRYVLHGRFPDGPGLIRHFLHKSFDHLHWEHHARPWDGNHINGTIKDTLPFVILLAGLAALFPLETAPVFLAGMIQSYIAEEWVHHSVHFYNFGGAYFRYIRRHHLYHHSPRGSEVGFGLTNGIWDVLRATRIPEAERRVLYERRSRRRPLPPSAPKHPDDLSVGV